MHAYASRGRGRPPGVRPDRTLNYNTITLLSAGVHICAGWLNIEKSFLTRFVVSLYIGKGPVSILRWILSVNLIYENNWGREKKTKLFIAPTCYIAVKIVTILNGYRSRILRVNITMNHETRLKMENFDEQRNAISPPANK